MDKNTAIHLLDKTFNRDFEQEQFSIFIKELFNDFQIKPQSLAVWKEYQEYIESYIRLGSYEDKTKKNIDILSVKLKKTSSRDRARTMQRNFIAKYLGNSEKDSALVAFYGDDPQDWRFSFVKMDYRLEETESGNVKPVKELTPAKRYSFLVGKNEPNYTCKRQFLPLVIEEKINPKIEEIEACFSVENVTKEFFTEYRELYYELKESLEKIMEKNTKVKKEFEEKGISTVDFSKKLLGQIVFIYFLQKKGWLGVNKDDKGLFREWGSGPKNFLRKLFEKEIANYTNFFNDVLEPLFYEALAIPRDEDYYSRFKCKIPFLNGGLFEPINDYDWVGTEIFLDNKIFADIFDTFDRYNFTVKEDEPLEKEVAIDPEMLGKVFENLLEVKDRKSKGSYYTPREIVHYMCQQSLINYLETNTSIPRNDIELFITKGEFIVAQAQQKLEEMHIAQEKFSKGLIGVVSFEKDFQELIDEIGLPKNIIAQREKIDKLLKDIKVVDPAVGSGAFPVGMMNEIVKARSILQIFLKTEKTSYDLKRETIENCLYGVDIDSSAVDIAKLRFWLSLIVDELDMKNIKPLPNLDHKIMCGNSLLEEFEEIKLFDERLLGETKKSKSVEEDQIKTKMKSLYLELGQINIGKLADDGRSREIKKELASLEKKHKDLKEEPDEEPKQQTLNDALNKRIRESQRKLSELRKLQKEFFNEQNRKHKKEQAQQINQLEWELIEETLKEQGNEEAIKRLAQYKKNKSKPFFLWKLYFAEVFQRQNPGFDIVIANPPYFPITNLPEDIKNILFENNPELKEGNFIGKIDIYSFFILKSLKEILRQNGELSYIIPKTILSNISFSRLRELITENYFIKELVDLDKVFEQVTGTMTYLLMFLKKEKAIRPYTLNMNTMSLEGKIEHFEIAIESLKKPPLYIWVLSKEKLLLVRKIEANAALLQDTFITKNGVCTGNNAKFLSLKKEDKNYQKIIVAKDIEQYHVKTAKHYVNYIPEKLHRPREQWIFKGSKIVSQMIRGLNTTRRLICALDDSNFLVLNNVNIIRDKNAKSDLPLLLGIINSALINFYFKTLVTDVNIKTVYLDIIPIKNGQSETKNKIKKIVDAIISITKKSDYLDDPEKQTKVKAFEAEIDKLVYKLYELTPEEIKLVEESVKE